MKRRSFIFKALASVAALSSASASALAQTASKTLVWIKTGLMGYKPKATADKVVAGKLCINCKWYKDDPKHEYGGQCTLKSITSGMKSEQVYVHAAGNCNMWQKK